MIRYIKGHGTENDFLLVGEEVELTPTLVRALCDRHAGLGADGVLRVVPVRSGTGARAGAGGGPSWFMDYRNADGSVAEMCGNGIRVFARHLVDAGLAGPGRLTVATRSGDRTVELGRTGDVTVHMGLPELLAERPVVGESAAVAVAMPNPHVVVRLPAGEAGLAALAGLDLSRPPAVAPPLPDGQNVEFVVRTGARALSVRVHERGVGETRSCGTGVCAAVVAEVVAGGGAGRGEPWSVSVPGGRLAVVWTAAGPVRLTGPAVLVAAGEMRPDWPAGG